MSGLMFGLQTVGRGVIPPIATAALLAIGGLAAIAFALHARRHPAPLLDFSLLREKTFAVSISAMFVFRAGIGAIPFLLPLMLQIGFGVSAIHSGLITFASAAGALVMKPVAQRALRWFGFRNTLFWNGLASALMLGLCAAFRPAWPGVLIYGVLLIGGFFRSLQFTAYNTLAYADIPRARISAATGFYTTVQQLALTMGVAVGATALELATIASGRSVPVPIDFSVAFLVVAVVSLTAAPIALAMQHDAGAELSGQRLGAGSK
jgi:Major Facilitator Superfamily